MAAVARGGRSEAIREYLEKHPEAKPKEIREALASAKIDVSPALVAQVSSKFRHGGKKAAGGKRGAKASATANGTAHAYGSTTDQLVRTKKFVKEVGSVDQARQALSDLEAFESV